MLQRTLGRLQAFPTELLYLISYFRFRYGKSIFKLGKAKRCYGNEVGHDRNKLVGAIRLTGSGPRLLNF